MTNVTDLKIPAIPNCGHEVFTDGCLLCVELAMSHDAAIRHTATPDAVEEADDAKLLKELIAELVSHAGETGKSEGAIDVLRRLSSHWRETHDDSGRVKIVHAIRDRALALAGAAVERGDAPQTALAYVHIYEILGRLPRG